MSLHIINKSHDNSLSRCLDYASDGDHLLFIEDGVYCCNAKFLKSNIGPYTLHALDADLEARAIKCGPEISAISINDFVKLTETHEKIISW